MFGARFDDVPGAEAFVLEGQVEELAATQIDDVEGVLAAAQDAARDGKWVAGYVTYDAAAAFDPAFIVAASQRSVLAWFGVFESKRMVPVAMHDPMASGAYAVSRWSPGIDRDQYRTSFDTVQRHVLDGDTYQVNFTFPLHAAFTGDPDVFYNDLVCAQKPSYAAHIWHGGIHVASVSPEKFFTISDRVITTQPMKGTAPRGRTPAEDVRIRDRLVTSEKDIAENLMIVDLIRNDIGRIAEIGSVETKDLFEVERYRTVWQMTSTVQAKLLGDVALADVFAALFPCGSVTGAPKPRSMEIIADIEHAPRGAYCGAVGFIPPGDGLEGASFNVAIRTVEVDEQEGVARYGVGGGVTWDSTVDSEYLEAVTKFEVLRLDLSPMDLMEAIRWDDGWVWLDDHLDRLESSAEYWDFAFDREGVEQLLTEVAKGLEQPSKVKVVSGRYGKVSVSVTEAPERWAEGPRPALDEVSLALDTEPIDDANPRMFHKTTDRRAHNARAERHADTDDVLMVNRVGRITESTVANVAFLIDGRWVTPPTLDGLLGGIMRAHLIDDGSLVERSVSIPEALNADAVALVSSIRGWRPAVIV